MTEDDFCARETLHVLAPAAQERPLLGLFAPALPAREPLEIQQESFVVIR
jgi:hypothetical protein